MEGRLMIRVCLFLLLLLPPGMVAEMRVTNQDHKLKPVDAPSGSLKPKPDDCYVRGGLETFCFLDYFCNKACVDQGYGKGGICRWKNKWIFEVRLCYCIVC